MLEKAIQTTTMSETQSTGKTLSTQRGKRTSFTKQENQEQTGISRLMGDAAAVAVYQNPFELSSLNGTNGFQINGIATGDNSGFSVSDAGDVNGDGYPDLIIGAYYASPSGRFGAGESYVVFGRSHFDKTLELSQLNGINGFQINGILKADESGYSVSGAGDVNADGYADIVIGARLASPNYLYAYAAGQSYVVFGQPNFSKTLELSQLNGMNGFQINGIAKLDFSGYSVSGAGDVNQDGYADIIVAAPWASPNGRPAAGECYVVFGQANFSKTLELSQLNGMNGFQINGIEDYDSASFSVGSAGDVNKDGYDDLIIGTPWAFPDSHESAGETYVVFGQASFEKTLELSQLNGMNGFQINGINSGDQSGWSVGGAGDVNGDSYADIIIGANEASPNGRSHAGQSYVLFGRSSFEKTFELSQLNGANGFEINGIEMNDQSGMSVGGAGDINKDGYADLIIGARYASPNGRANAGESYVIFGGASFEKTFELSQLNGTNGFQLNGISSSDNSGGSVSGAGDVNQDGYADLIIGAYLASPGRSQAGESYVVFGSAGVGMSSNAKLVPTLKNEINQRDYSEITSGADNEELPAVTNQDNPAYATNTQRLLNSVTSGLKSSYERGKQYWGSFWHNNRVATLKAPERDLSASEMDRLEALTDIERTLTQLTKTLSFSKQVDLYQNSESLMNALAFYQRKIADWQNNVKAVSKQDMKDLREDVMKLENAVMGGNIFSTPDIATASKRNSGFFNPMNVRAEVAQPMLGAQNNMRLMP